MTRENIDSAQEEELDYLLDFRRRIHRDTVVRINSHLNDRNQVVTKKNKPLQEEQDSRLLQDKTLKLMHHESNTEYTSYSNPVKISNHEFIIGINSNKQLIKYDIYSKEWTEFVNFDDNLDEKLEDWKIKTNFKNLQYVGYLCDNAKIIAAEMIRQCKNKIFLHFGFQFQHFGARYAWIQVPNDRLCVAKDAKSDRYYRLSYDEKYNTYYMIYDSKTEAIIINITDKTVEKYIVAQDKYYIHSCLAIDDKLHMIGTHDLKYYHIIFDRKKKTSKIKYHFHSVIVENLRFVAKLIHIPSLKCILFIIRHQIWQYSLDNEVWNKLDVLMPYLIPKRECNVFLTNNNRFVMIFGCDYNCYLDLENMKFTTLDIMWPNGYHPQYALNMGNIGNVNIEMIIYGFTRNVWIHQHILSFPPHDLLRLIMTFYQDEHIHLLMDHKKHSILNMMDIMPSYSSIS